MSALDIVKKINKKLKESDSEKLIEVWNIIFPKTESLKEGSFDNKSNKELILEEVRMMILDELKTNLTSEEIVKVYNILHKKKISIEDVV